jgi:hypothetical protein
LPSQFVDWLFLSVIGLSFAIVFFKGGWGIYKTFRENQKKRKTFFGRVVYGALLPMNFVAIFLQKRKEREMPLYFRWFLWLTRTCSKIPLFHFIPKFIVAVTSEFLVYQITGSKLLTGVVFLWSISFFIIITIVEGQLGELHEEAITEANKFFLFSVSWVTLSTIFVGLFLYDSVIPFFDNAFWHFVTKVLVAFNDYLSMTWNFFWNMHIVFILLFFLILFLYIGTSLSLSHYMQRKKKKE